MTVECVRLKDVYGNDVTIDAHDFRVFLMEKGFKVVGMESGAVLQFAREFHARHSGGVDTITREGVIELFSRFPIIEGEDS